MKISELRQIIKEEISRLNEVNRSLYYQKDIKKINLNSTQLLGDRPPLQWVFDVYNHYRMMSRNRSMLDNESHTCYVSEGNYNNISFLAYYFWGRDGRIWVKITEEKNGSIVFLKKYYYDKEALKDFKKIIGQTKIKFFKTRNTPMQIVYDKEN